MISLLRSNIYRRFSTDFISKYQSLINSGELKLDHQQAFVVTELQKFYEDLQLPSVTVTEKIEIKGESSSWRLFGSQDTVKYVTKQVWRKIPGIYLYGSPGCGKTYLLDLFYDFVSLSHKRRVHFNKFMLEVHQIIHQLNKADVPDSEKGFDPVPKVAIEISKKARLLCFDEFQVTDIADAMILKRLFGKLWEEGVAIFATSNRPPDDLYYNGLQRFLFLPFIDELKNNCKIIDMNSNVDYRYGGDDEHLRTFIWPHDTIAEQEAKKTFLKVSGKEKGESLTIPVMQGRSLTCKNSANGCGVFTFKELCEEALGAADYISIAQHFHHVIMIGIPTFSVHRRDIMRRFILLIDELYNRKVKLTCTAEVGIDDLYTEEGAEFDEVFAFDRTVSRLTEMQSKEYAELPHSPII